MYKSQQNLGFSEVTSKMDKLMEENEKMTGEYAINKVEDTMFKEEVRQFIDEVKEKMDEETKLRMRSTSLWTRKRNSRMKSASS